LCWQPLLHHTMLVPPSLSSTPSLPVPVQRGERPSTCLPRGTPPPSSASCLPTSPSPLPPYHGKGQGRKHGELCAGPQTRPACLLDGLHAAPASPVVACACASHRGSASSLTTAFCSPRWPADKQDEARTLKPHTNTRNVRFQNKDLRVFQERKRRPKVPCHRCNTSV
jgi:hypothetical protein